MHLTEQVEYELPESPGDMLLIVPPTYPEGRDPDYNPKPPLSLESLAGAAKVCGFEVSIADFDVIGASAEDVVKEVLRINPTRLGVSVLQRALPSVKYIHENLRAQGYRGTILYGGIGATLCHESMLRTIEDDNYGIILGEGEIPLIEFLSSVKAGANWRATTPSLAYRGADGKIVYTQAAPLPSLDELPWPDRQNLDYYLAKTKYGTFLSSRGCYWGACTFCSNAAFEQRHGEALWRPRNPEDVVAELSTLYKTHGIKMFKSNDANLFGPVPEGRMHVINLCEAIIRAKANGDLPGDLSLMSFVRGVDVASDRELLRLMKTAGFDRLLIGVESSDNETLTTIFNKGETSEVLTRAIIDMRAEGISVIAGFMIFHPGTTLSSLRRDLAYLHDNNLKVTLAKSLRIFNNTPLQRILDAQGRLHKNSPFETYHEYEVPREVSAVYFALKCVHVDIEDPLRQIAQKAIWEVKSQGQNFNNRNAYANLTEHVWHMESTLLEACLDYYADPSRGSAAVRSAVDEIFEHSIPQMAEALGVAEIETLIISKEALKEKIIRILTDLKTSTLHEEYVWNEV